MTDGYGDDVVALQVLVLLWQTYWMVRSLRALARGDRRTILFVQLVYYFFFAIPQLLDLVIGPPVYVYHRGFMVSQFDHTTNVVYLIYLAIVPVLFELLGGRPATRDTSTASVLRMGGWVRLFSWAAIIALPFALVLAPEPEHYLGYAAFIGRELPGAEQYHTIVTLVALLTALACVLVLSTEGPLPIERVATLPFLMVAVWVHGKRSIVALTLLMLLYLLWSRGVLRGRRFVAAALAAGLVLGGFSYAYQSQVRDVSDRTPMRGQGFAASDLYLNYRIDYGRDAVTKQTLYAELNPDELKILDYRGQSLVFDALFFVPRSMWPGKPLPYGVYATSALFGVSDEYLGWGITTSWLEEAIANFSWLGLLVGPAVPALVCAIGDRRRSPLVAILTLSTASFLLVLHLPAFIPLALLWVATVIRARRVG